ncbi:hypothetical protein JOC94_004320 [Bacillus thermophilus]|uniref:Uncharacterized protein n=1 Tax=Siminovitchia thermophila TaxID=1245522 RepID=A0ABS2RCB1_9BACI|nr:hypothetical protein [Siminovitchia thermophila]MBM7717295.1 hypothetical protein [Siminovitchia thermophila]ONK24293.1 hypothetical protein BLX87_06095 [Bacillus sp. VT-16-64]
MRMSEFGELKNFILFVKFTKKEYAKSILGGNLYMNNIGYFIGLEKDNRIKGVGDKREAGLVREAKDLIIVDMETNKVLFKAPKGEIIQRYEKSVNIPIFCYSMFTADDFVVLEDNKENLSFKLDIGKDTEKFLEFGDTAIIFPNNFHHLLIDSAESHKLQGRVNKVSYDKFDKINEEREKLFQSGTSDMFFWKHEDFKYQREVRFVLPRTFVDSHYLFKMKEPYEKIATVSTKDFFTNTAIIATKNKAS